MKKYIRFLKFTFWGTIASIINILVYWGLSQQSNMSTANSTIIAWCISNLFAFFTSKVKVFAKADNSEEGIFSNKRIFISEFCSFFAGRLLTGILDVVCMIVLVDRFGFSGGIIKVVLNALFGIINYLMGCQIFNNTKYNNEVKKRDSEIYG